MEVLLKTVSSQISDKRAESRGGGDDGDGGDIIAAAGEGGAIGARGGSGAGGGGGAAATSSRSAKQVSTPQHAAQMSFSDVVTPLTLARDTDDDNDDDVDGYYQRPKAKPEASGSLRPVPVPVPVSIGTPSAPSMPNSLAVSDLKAAKVEAKKAIVEWANKFQAENGRPPDLDDKKNVKPLYLNLKKVGAMRTACLLCRVLNLCFGVVVRGRY